MVVVKTPAECTSAEIDEFVELCSCLGLTALNGLRKRIGNAVALAFVRIDGKVVSIGAIKQPVTNYRDNIGDSAGIDLDGCVELGWCYTLPDCRGKGHFAGIVAKLLATVKTPVYATTGINNVPTHRVNLKNGLQRSGRSYQGATGVMCVFCRW